MELGELLVQSDWATAMEYLKTVRLFTSLEVYSVSLYQILPWMYVSVIEFSI
jgi:hypothetical protein